MDFLLTLKHPNIVDHIAFFDEVHKGGLLRESTRFFLVMEFCAGGSLEDLIRKHCEEKKPFETQVLIFK